VGVEEGEGVRRWGFLSEEFGGGGWDWKVGGDLLWSDVFYS